jgi:phosphatidylserine/phosphatidylglycerophosphate/cardiolipin synthase-like enzyme
MNLKDEVIGLIDDSIEDNFLTKSEKNQIKASLQALSPDKRISDLLRSELFKIAKNQINADNYMEVLLWTEKVNKLILSANKVEVQQESVYFSPGEECLNAILRHIRRAKNRIRICLFTISDDRIADELISKSKQGVSVKIITDNDKMFDKGSDIEKLNRAGVPIRVDMTRNHMHHKFALFDGDITLTGSYNWTRSAERYNHENILITDSSKVLREFNKEFDLLWDEFPDLSL